MAFQKWKEEETTTYTSFVQPKGETAGPMNGMVMAVLVFDTSSVYHSKFLCCSTK